MPWQRAVKTIAIIIFTLFALLGILPAIVSVLLMSRQSTGATWNGITIGQSTAEQVIAELGPPDEVEGRRTLSGPFETYRYYADQEDIGEWPATYSIEILREVVISIDDYSFGQHDVYLSEFIELYGTPDHVTWGQDFYGARVVIFLDDGVLVEVLAQLLPEDTWVGAAHYFQPCSMTCIRAMFPWGVFRGSQVPPEFPGMYEYPPELDQEDPWGFTD